MKAFFKSMFQDERGSISHKRMIATLCTIILCVCLIIGSNPSETLVHAVEGIVIACIAGTTLDKFTFKKPEESDNS